jgi:NAD+ synthase (glutamine-hydrolysing)
VAIRFDSLYQHGFARMAVGVPALRVADPAFNAEQILGLARRASAEHAALCLFPELGLSCYSAEDLFHQEALLSTVQEALSLLTEQSATIGSVVIVGAPLRVAGGLFNCAVVLHRGRVLGVVPKSYLPGYREFYEKRQFAAARDTLAGHAVLAGRSVPFGADLLFEATDVDDLMVHVEICEDLWVPIPPSSYAALAGATVLVNLSASNITIGKAGFRRLLCQSQSARCLAAYLYAAAGPGESTTDLAWDGHGLISENGDLLAESERFAAREQLITADVDLGRLVAERVRMTSFADAVHDPVRARPAAPGHRPLPLRPHRSGEPGRTLRGGVQHPGPGPGHPLAGHRHPPGRHRCLWRPGLHAGPHRGGAGHGPP